MRRLKRLKETGLYNPQGELLTRHRKRKINTLYKENEKYLDKSKTQFVKIPKKYERNRPFILKKAKKMGMPVSSTGMFYPKEGQRRATVQRNYETHEYEIRRTGKIKWGPNRGKRISDAIPIANISELSHEEARIKKLAKTFKLGKGEHIYFKVVQFGREALSKEMFSTPEQLIKYLKERYSKTVPNQLIFLRHIKVEKATVVEWKTMRRELRPPKKRKVNKTGRNI